MNPIDGKQIYRATIIGMIVNIVLTVLKFFAGIVGRSSAMVADAIHSASDFATDIVVLACVKIASKPKDATHNYGHGKFETMATLMIGIALAVVAVGIFVDGARNIERAVSGEILPRPDIIAFYAAALSILVKELLFWYTVSVARRTSSSALKANAWHHRSDALSSVATLLGVGCARFLGEQWRILDPIAAIAVAALIVKVAIELMKPALDELLERSLPADVEEQILAIISSEPAVSKPHNLRTRRIGRAIEIDCHIRLDGALSVVESHEITRRIEGCLREKYGEGTIIMLHVEPIK